MAQWGITAAGFDNHNAGNHSVIAGGRNNNIFSNTSVIGGGEGNSTFNEYSTVPGGKGNIARGRFSFAAGRLARADSAGSFVWGDTTDVTLTSERDNQFLVRAGGGAKFKDGNQWIDLRDDGVDLISTSSGAHLTLGGAWTNSSDENAKENFAQVDAAKLLEQIAALDIREWNYRIEDDAVRHIGPTAQEFHAAFGLGTDDKSISTIDPAGIALAAIQELHRKTQTIDEMQERIAQLEILVERLASERR